MRTFGLIGGTLAHSFSAAYFTKKFEEQQINAVYKNFPLQSIGELNELLVQNPEMVGLNVTIPFKQSVIPFLDTLSPEAEAVGAVNTIHISNGVRKGHNTDVAGFAASIKPFLAFGMERALVLGNGGAAAAVHYVFQRLGIEVWHVVRQLSSQPRFREMTYGDVNKYVLKACHIIVNATPVGTWPSVEERPKLPYSYVSTGHLLVDLVYNPPTTEFMKEGQAQGAVVLNGLSMLHNQAEESWKIWNSNQR